MKSIFGSLDPFMELGDILGRRVANSGFLHAFMALDPFDEYHFFLPGERECADFRALAKAHFPAQEQRMKAYPRQELPQALSQTAYHAFHLSDCITHQPQLARLRNLHSKKLFPITGVTHSLSYAHYGPAFLAHLWPGTTPRDCIVCTSRTGQSVVENYFSFLREGWGLSKERFLQPSLRRVPLAVDTDHLAPAAPKEKRAARKRLSLPNERVVFLVFGRLSHYSKMDLLPLLRAFKRCIDQGMEPASFTLALAGWVEEGENYHQAVIDMAASLGIDAQVFARPSEAQKLDLYAASDVFVSIADNVQETFGITILEAQAAGLAVVASEYDGYRDLVRDNETGLLVPTLVAAKTPGIDPLAPLIFDSDSHFSLAQQTVVDVPALAAALLALHTDSALRAELGRAARSRIAERYSWTKIIKDYLALWDELWTLPAKRHSGPHPMELPYGQLFGHYTTSNSHDAMVVRSSEHGQRIYQGKDLPVIYPGMAHWVNAEALNALLFAARKPISQGEIVARLADMGQDVEPQSVHVLVMWALKHDILELEP